MKKSTDNNLRSLDSKVETLNQESKVQLLVDSPENVQNTILNQDFLESLPYPAMYIRKDDRIILFANEQAQGLGAKVGDKCWRVFGKEKYLSNESKKIINATPIETTDENKIKCKFCLGDECFLGSKSQKKSNIHAFNRIWNTHWTRVSDNVFLHFLVDITYQQNTVDELKRNEFFIKQTQEIAMLGTYYFDIQKDKWESSDVLDKILGLENKTTKNFHDWMEILHPDNKEMMLNYFTQEIIGKKNEVFDKEYKICRKSDNKTVWVHGRGQLKYDKQGNALSMVGAIQDITERKNTEAELRSNKLTLETVLDQFPGVVFWKDKDSKYLGCNHAFALGAGLQNSSEIIGKTDFDLPWETTEASAYIKDDAEVMKSQTAKLHYVESQHQTKNQLTWFDTSKIPFTDNNSEVTGVLGVSIDITKQKNEELKLIRNLKFTEVLLKSIPTPVFFKDLEGKYTGCNEAFTNQLGVTKEEIIGKTVMEIWPSEQAHIYHQNDLDLLKTKKFQTYEAKVTDKNHQLRDVVYAKNVFSDENGQVVGIVGTYLDITEQKKIENALRKNEEKLQTVANYTNDWEYWTDPQGNFNYCSPSCERITGYNLHEFLTNSQLINEMIYPEDLNIYLNTKNSQFIRQNENAQTEYRIIRKDGAIRWIGHAYAHIYDEAGEYLGIRGSDRDVTERKETEVLLKASEQKYKLLSENISEGIFTCRNGYIEHMNKSMCIIFDCDEIDLYGVKLNELVLPEYKSEFNKFISVKTLKNKTKSIEVECLRKDKTTIFVEIVLNSIGNNELSYGVIHDITQKKQLHKKDIVSAIIQTEENERANFSKELHDGLGPLLSAIKLYLQWSRRPKSNKSSKEIILKAEEILEEALVAVREISNKLSPHLLSNYGLTSATQSFVNKFQETKAIEIEFTSNLARRFDNEIEIALYRAIIECVNNTIKYSMAKNITISINEMDTQIQLVYTDNGKGFDMDKTLAEKKGLGLFNLQNRIQTIGGQIQLYSKPDKGVKYNIIVPIQQE